MIDSPGDSFFMLTMMEGPTDPDDNVTSQVEAYVPNILKKTSQAPFTRWGRYEGAGMKLHGRQFGLVDANVRIFPYSTDSQSFIVVEYTFDEDLKNVQPGFQLIESSFELIDSPKTEE